MPVIHDNPQRLEFLRTEFKAVIARSFTDAMRGIQDALDEPRVFDFSEAALVNLLEPPILNFASELQELPVRAAQDTVKWVSNEMGTPRVFDSTDFHTVDDRVAIRSRIKEQFLKQQVEVVRYAVTLRQLGDTAGLATDELIALSAGLTKPQLEAALRHRTALLKRSRDDIAQQTEALKQAREAIDVADIPTGMGEPLTMDQVELAFERTLENKIHTRINTIKETEATKLAHLGNDWGYRQLRDQGLFSAADVTRRWVSYGARHAPLAGKEISPLDKPFFNEASGNFIQFPGDPHAPASEIISCSCTIETEIDTGD